MSCVKPLEAFRSENGSVIFNNHNSATKVPMALPCGQCIGCRLERARQWGTRCVHESKMHEHSSFVTLTYNDDSLPPGGSLDLRDLQLFMKRLRKSRVAGGQVTPVRFFAGGEYGELNNRPHYHLLLFNCRFSNLVEVGTGVGGQTLYTSDELFGLWPRGFHTIGAVTMQSAQYCAKYAMKKLNRGSTDESLARFQERYQVFDENGEVFDRRPEFAVMSRRPGIGATYYEKYGDEVRALDNVIVDGREAKLPRYYDVLSERIAKEQLEKHKRARRREAVLKRFDNTPERLRVKERRLILLAERCERKL
jgi:hypothetical protein